MSERFLLTGGSGFIGSALVRRLIRDGKTVTNLDALTYAATPEALAEIAEHPRYGFVRGSITDKRRVRSVLRDSHPTVVVNLAAESHVDRSIDEPSIFVSTNVLGTTTLLEETTEYWRGLDPGSRNSFRFVHVSTDEVFGSIDTGLFDDSSPYDPSSPYAASKAAGDHMVRAWHRTYGLPALITNCANNYGPYQFPEKLIPLMIVRALAGKSLPVYGDGGNVRDWIHVDDHVSGLLLAADRGRPGDTYLLGSRSRAPISNWCSRSARFSMRKFLATQDRTQTELRWLRTDPVTIAATRWTQHRLRRYLDSNRLGGWPKGWRTPWIGIWLTGRGGSRFSPTAIGPSAWVFCESEGDTSRGWRRVASVPVDHSHQ